MRIVDLSFPIRPHFRWKVEPKLTKSHAAGDVFQSTVLTVACHAYTHVDAPVHFLPGDREIASMPVDQWIGDAAVVDLSHLGDNAEVTAAELEQHAGHVRRGDIALLRTDWPTKVSVESEKFWRDAPYTGRSACDWLVRRGVKAVGYDYPPDYTVRTSIFEPGVKLTPEQCTTHHVFFPAGVTVIEYLTSLDRIGVPRCRCASKAPTARPSAPSRSWTSGIICRMPRPWLALLAVVVAAAGCTDQPSASVSAAASVDKPPTTAPLRPVKVFQTVEERVPRTVTSTGALAADDTVVLGVKVPGRLVEQAVDLGTRVRKGQLIARIEQTDYRLRVEQAEAALQQARARLGLSLTGTDEQVDPEKTSIVRQARAVLDEARLARERSAKLVEQNLIAQAQDDTAEANLGVAEGRYHDALEEVRNRQATLTQRRSELELARQQLADTVLVSPFDGAVSARQAAVGEYLAAGAPVATLVRTHPLRLRLPVPEREAVGVRVGQAVRLTVEGDTNGYQGRVVRLSPVVQEQNRTLLVEAEVPNPSAVLKPGAFARADIVTEGSQPVIRVPAASMSARAKAPGFS